MVSYWLPDVTGGRPCFLFVARMNRGFLLALRYDGKEVAISIGRRHELWFPIWLPDVLERKSRFSTGRRHELWFPIGYLM